MKYIDDHPRGLILKVRAKPGASRDKIMGPYGDRIKVSVRAVPEKGKANAALVALLEEELKLASGSLFLFSGETSQEKKFLISGYTRQEVEEKLAPLL